MDMTSSTAKQGLRLGTTLYSLTTEFHGRQYSFEQLIRNVAAQNLGPGLEVVGFQSIKGFPEITDAFADNFAALIDETGLELSCLGINADVLNDRSREMTQDESVAYHERQMRAAARLGFPLVRYQYAAGTEVVRRLVPLAEKLNLKLGLEIHAPQHVDHPEIVAYRELYEEVGSPMLGFIPDFGSSAHAVPPSFIDYNRELGAPEWLIEMALEWWPRTDGDGMERLMAFYDAALAKGADERYVVELYPMFGLFGHQPPEAWADIMPQVIHIHGKFFDFDETGNELSVDFARTLKVFVEGGYNGFMSSEYEGHHWTDSDAFERLRLHHKLCRTILADLRVPA